MVSKPVKDKEPIMGALLPVLSGNWQWVAELPPVVGFLCLSPLLLLAVFYFLNYMKILFKNLGVIIIFLAVLVPLLNFLENAGNFLFYTLSMLFVITLGVVLFKINS